MRKDPLAGPDFEPEHMPRWGTPRPEGMPRYFRMDCCTRDDCVQRDYNRAALLSLENASRLLASFYLLRDATQAVWSCDDAGHTENCPKPGCVFARDRDNDLKNTEYLLVSALKSLCHSLATTSVDLTPQWQEFTDAEQAWIGLQAAVARDQDEGEELFYLESLRDQAVNGDDVAHDRWFRAPAFSDGSPEA